MSEMYERVQARLHQLRKTARAASLEAGMNADYIRDMKRSKNTAPSAEALRSLARVLETTPDWLLRGEGDEVRGAGERPASTEHHAPVQFRPSPEFLGDRDLPVYSAVEGGSGEMVVLNDHPIEVVPRPWVVQNVKEAYAVLVVGESMIPAFKPGMMAVVNPKLPLVRDEPAIFISHLNGDFKATIKELVRSLATEWVVRQWNPPEGQTHEFRLPKAEWTEAYRVVGAFYR